MARSVLGWSTPSAGEQALVGAISTGREWATSGSQRGQQGSTGAYSSPAGENRQTAASEQETQAQRPSHENLLLRGLASLPFPTGRGPRTEAYNLGWSLMEGDSKAREPPKRWAARRADILEISRMGSHEVSEALVSKRATREAEREERGVSQRGEQSRKGGRPTTQYPGQAGPIRGRTCGGRHSSR